MDCFLPQLQQRWEVQCWVEQQKHWNLFQYPLSFWNLFQYPLSFFLSLPLSLPSCLVLLAFVVLHFHVEHAFNELFIHMYWLALLREILAAVGEITYWNTLYQPFFFFFSFVCLLSIVWTLLCSAVLVASLCSSLVVMSGFTPEKLMLSQIVLVRICLFRNNESNRLLPKTLNCSPLLSTVGYDSKKAICYHWADIDSPAFLMLGLRPLWGLQIRNETRNDFGRIHLCSMSMALLCLFGMMMITQHFCHAILSFSFERIC